VKILIGGDVCPIGRNEQAFVNPSGMLPLRQFYEDADLVLVNLECPLIAQPTPVLKGGPVLGVAIEAVAGLVKLGVDVTGLANNHIMDHGTEGLQSTIDTLNGSGIRTVGAGKNILHAKQPLLTQIGGANVAILAFAEHEYSIASTDRAGACPIDTNLVVRSLRTIPEDSISIVLLHCGNEYYPYPNPWLQDTCRLMVEFGANIVVCQHNHCIGTYEAYQGALIVYGQGNLILDYPSKNDGFFEGLLIGAEFKEGKLVKYEFIPVVQDHSEKILRKIIGADRTRILNALENRSEVLKHPQELEFEWQKFCHGKKRVYQTLLFGFNRVFHVLNKITGFADFVSKRGKMNIGNVLRCASHLEVLKTVYSLEKTTERPTNEK
jgi:Bacterial capsule synthesis protein PGA_cap